MDWEYNFNFSSVDAPFTPSTVSNPSRGDVPAGSSIPLASTNPFSGSGSSEPVRRNAPSTCPSWLDPALAPSQEVTVTGRPLAVSSWLDPALAQEVTVTGRPVSSAGSAVLSGNGDLAAHSRASPPPATEDGYGTGRPPCRDALNTTVGDGASAGLQPRYNNTSWAARNPGLATIPLRQKLTPAEKARANHLAAKRKLEAPTRLEKETSLNDAVKELLKGMHERVQGIATEHDVRVEKVHKLLGGQQFYKPSRNAQLPNALLFAKANEVNSGLPHGQKHNMDELRQMIKEDENMQNLSGESKEAYINALDVHRATKNMSVRANNAASAKDVQLTLDHVFKLLDGLAVRTGTYTCLFATRGHVFDTSQATWFGTDNIMDFWEDVMKWEPDVITRKLEQWACSHGDNIDERNSIEHMQKTCGRLIASGLSAISKRDNVRMNFVNYDSAIKTKLGIQLIGWPEGVPFQSPFNITDIEHVRNLRDALKSGICRWERLSMQQQREHTTALQVRRNAGEMVGRQRKKRSDAGVSRKRKGQSASEDPGSAKRRRAAPAPASAELIENEDSEGDSDA